MKKYDKSKNLFIDELKKIKKFGIAMEVIAMLFVLLIFLLSHFTYSHSARKYFTKQAVETLTNISNQMSEKIQVHIDSWNVELKYVKKSILQCDTDDDIYNLFESIDFLSDSEFDDVGAVTENGRIYFDRDDFVDISSDPDMTIFLEQEKEYIGCPDELINDIVFAVPYNKSNTHYAEKSINGERIIGTVGIVAKSNVSKWLETSVFGEEKNYIVITDEEGNLISDNDGTKDDGVNIIDKLSKYVYDKATFESLIANLKAGIGGAMYMSDEDERFLTYCAPSNRVSKETDEMSITLDKWYIFVMTREASIIKNISSLFDESRVFLYVVLVILAVVLILVCLVDQRNKIAKCRLRSVDSLTNAHNNARFVNDANILLERDNRDYAVIAFNISKFRLINNEIGHDKGDMVLRTVGETVLENLKDDELITRSFADRFMMLVRLRGRTPEEVVESFRSKLSEAEYPNGAKVTFGAGVYIIKPEEHDISVPMDCARFAQSRLKEKNGAHDGIMIYSQEMLDKQKNEFKLENRAAEAMEKGYFKVYYQLKRDIQNNCWCGAEALVRWIDPELGFISPGEFIPLFEKNGFVKTIDKYVFECVCRDMEECIKAGRRICPVSVNVSRKHLDDENFLDEYEKILLGYDIPHEMIEFEITESMLTENEELLKTFIKRVHDLGCTCSLDDFGCGYSSFNMVRDFDFDTIKLDRKFFYSSNGFDRSSQMIVESLIDLSHKLGKMVISEGIEQEEQVEFLRSRGCDAVQGFYFSKPAPLDESIGSITQNGE